MHQGLVYHDDVFQDLKTGDKLTGWVKKTRKDNKIDITLQRRGYRSIEPNADAVYNELQLQNGFLPLTDKSTPEEIKNWLEMSKKSFKRAVGKLYKKRLISIEEDGIRLI